MNYVLWLTAAFAVKHFICDFPLQATPYMYKNKGDLKHLGGYIHAGIHAFVTFLILPASILFSCLALAEFVVHYTIDFSKVNLCRHYDLTPNNSEWYWILLGLDQLLHSLTYVAIIYFVVIYGQIS